MELTLQRGCGSQRVEVRHSWCRQQCRAHRVLSDVRPQQQHGRSAQQQRQLLSESLHQLCRGLQHAHTLHASADSTANTALRSSQSDRFALSCGQHLELLQVPAKAGSPTRPPLLFLHGAMHGAWCYREHFLPYFASKGYDAYAVSLRAHGESDYVEGETGSFDDHLDDLASVIASLPRPPVVVAHSLGGILLQRYLCDLIQGQQRPQVAGVGFVASPAIQAALGPSLDWFKQLRGFMHGFQIVWWMVAMPKNRRGLVRQLFFSPDLPEEDFQIFHAKMAASRSLLPVTGQELMQYSKEVERALQGGVQAAPVPVVVLRAGEDRMIMPCQVTAIADMFGVEALVAPGVAHDCMLDTRWKNAAQMLEEWLKGIPGAESTAAAYSQQLSGCN